MPQRPKTGFVLQGHIYSSKEPEMMRCFADFKHAVLSSDSVCMCCQVCTDFIFKSGPINYKTLWGKINKILISCVFKFVVLVFYCPKVHHSPVQNHRRSMPRSWMVCWISRHIWGKVPDLSSVNCAGNFWIYYEDFGLFLHIFYNLFKCHPLMSFRYLHY